MGKIGKVSLREGKFAGEKRWSHLLALIIEGKDLLPTGSFFICDSGFEFYIKSYFGYLFLDREFLQVCLLQPAHVL